MAVEFSSIFKNSRTYYKRVNDLFLDDRGCNCKRAIEIMCLVAGCEKPLNMAMIVNLLGYSYPALKFDWVSLQKGKVLKRDKRGKHYFTDKKNAQYFLEWVSPFAKEWYSDMDKHFDLIALMNTIKNWNELSVPYPARRGFTESLVFNDLSYCHSSVRNQAIEDFRYLYENKEEFEKRFTAERAEIVRLFNAADKTKTKAN